MRWAGLSPWDIKGLASLNSGYRYYFTQPFVSIASDLEITGPSLVIKRHFINTLRFRYQTYEIFDIDIHMRSLRDTQQFQDDDGIAEKLGINSTLWSLFGVVWDSSQVLAHHMYDFPIEGKRVLEVGCGLALTSLLLNQRLADITCTDYHPEVEAFLRINTSLNNKREIPFFLADWNSTERHSEKFDLIIGSDLLYETGHDRLLADFLEIYAKPDCEIIIVDPGRGRLNRFTAMMKDFSFSLTQEHPKNNTYLTAPFKGTINRYSRAA